MKSLQDRRKEFEKHTYALSGGLFKLAYWRLANVVDAEDVVQESYLRAFRSFHTFTPGTNFKGWMNRILLNVVNDTLKKRQRENEFIAQDGSDEIRTLPDHSATAKNPETRMMEKEIRPDLKEALDRLPTSLLHPLLLREIEEMSYGEIAETLGIPTGTVMSRLFRARKVVREHLGAVRLKQLSAEAFSHELQ